MAPYYLKKEQDKENDQLNKFLKIKERTLLHLNSKSTDINISDKEKKVESMSKDLINIGKNNDVFHLNMKMKNFVGDTAILINMINSTKQQFIDIEYKKNMDIEAYISKAKQVLMVCKHLFDDLEAKCVRFNMDLKDYESRVPVFNYEMIDLQAKGSFRQNSRF